MTQACIETGQAFGVCLIRGGFELGVPANPAAIGCKARIVGWSRPMTERHCHDNGVNEEPSCAVVGSGISERLRRTGLRLAALGENLADER